MGLLFDLFGTGVDIGISNSIIKDTKKSSANEILEKYFEANNIQKEQVEKLFYTEEVFDLRNKDTKNKEIVLTGTLVKGHLRVGDKLKYVQKDGSVREFTVTLIEIFRKELEEANEGQFVGIHTDLPEKIDRFTILFQDNR